MYILIVYHSYTQIKIKRLEDKQETINTQVCSFERLQRAISNCERLRLAASSYE